MHPAVEGQCPACGRRGQALEGAAAGRMANQATFIWILALVACQAAVVRAYPSYWTRVRPSHLPRYLPPPAAYGLRHQAACLICDAAAAGLRFSLRPLCAHCRVWHTMAEQHTHSWSTHILHGAQAYPGECELEPYDGVGPHLSPVTDS